MYYDLSFAHPNNHTFTIKLKITDPNPNGQRISLPNWIPGSYMIRDFSRNILSIKASTSCADLQITQVDKSTWDIESTSEIIFVEYTVYAFDLSVRSAHLDDSHAFFNGCSLLLKVSGKEMETHWLNIAKPIIEQSWSVKTGLQITDVDLSGFGTYQAQNYDELIDCPVEISESMDIEFSVLGKPHFLHLTGDHLTNIDVDRLAHDLTSICHQQASIFCHDLPFCSYLFLTTVVNKGYGGLEHKNSTSLICSHQDLPTIGMTEATNDYIKFLGLCSHEYFHLWNVKRIKPTKLINTDLSSEAYTTLLWAFEGITSYYDDLALLRSSCISFEQYLDLLAHTLSRYFRSQGRFTQTLLDSSFNAWTKFYKQDENSINSVVSYYVKGMVVAFGLDVMIRSSTNHVKSLDDLMSYLWRQYGVNELGIGEQEIEKAASFVANTDLSSFFDLTLRSTDELPISEWLAHLGIGMHLRIEQSSDDVGGFVHQVNTQKLPRLTFGCSLKKGLSTEIASVLNGSPAEDAGLSPGDVFVAINKEKVTPENFDALIQKQKKAMPVSVAFFRREFLDSVQLFPTEHVPNVCELYLLDAQELSIDQLEFREKWMQSSL